MLEDNLMAEITETRGRTQSEKERSSQRESPPCDNLMPEGREAQGQTQSHKERSSRKKFGGRQITETQELPPLWDVLKNKFGNGRTIACGFL